MVLLVLCTLFTQAKEPVKQVQALSFERDVTIRDSLFEPFARAFDSLYSLLDKNSFLDSIYMLRENGWVTTLSEADTMYVTTRTGHEDLRFLPLQKGEFVAGFDTVAHCEKKCIAYYSEYRNLIVFVAQPQSRGDSLSLEDGFVFLHELWHAYFRHSKMSADMQHTMIEQFESLCRLEIKTKQHLAQNAFKSEKY